MTKRIRIVAVGDVMLGEHPLCLGHGVGSVAHERGSGFVFANVATILRTGDIVFGNLENMLLDAEDATGLFERRYLRGRKKDGEGLVEAGFTVMNLANNHALQHGPLGLQQTIRTLEENGIKHIGLRGHDAAICEIGARRIGVLGCCDDQQYELHTEYVELIDLAKISSNVARLKGAGVDRIIVSLHWGDEFVSYPSPGQVRLARAIIDAGADLILGHHSHVVQGIERYKHGVIVYSLGNFISDMQWDRSLRESAIVICDVPVSGPIAVSVIPVVSNDCYQPEVATGRAARRITKRIERASHAIVTCGATEDSREASAYRRHAKYRRYRNRFQMYGHFARHLPTYGKGVALDILRFFLKKKWVQWQCSGRALFAKSNPIR